MVRCYANSKEKVQSLIDQNGGVAILEFCTKTCTDCDKLDSYLDEMNNENIAVIKIDCDEAKDLCKSFKCEGIPCFAVVKENMENVTECRQCHETKEVLDIFNKAVQCRKNLGKMK